MHGIWFIIELVILVTLFFIISLRFPQTQTYLAQKLTQKLSNDLGTTLSIKKVNIHPLDKISLENLFVVDLYGDTVLNTKALDINIADIKLKQQEIEIEAITLTNADIKLIKPVGQKGFSFQFIIDHFSNDKPKKDKKNTPFTIKGKAIDIVNSDFYFINKRSSASYSGMDFTDLALKNINLSIANVTNQGSKTTGVIKHLSTYDKSKFELKNLSTSFTLDSNFALLDSLNIRTNNSNIEANYFKFEFNDPNDFDDDFVEKVTMKADFKRSQLNLGDLSYFTSFFNGLNRSVDFSGYFDGTVDDFKTKNLYIQLDNNTSIGGNLAMKGLPYTDSTSFNFSNIVLRTNEKELQNIELPPFVRGDKIKLPEELDGIGLISGTGNLAGTFDDVKGNLMLTSSIGNVNTKSRYWLNKKTNTSFFEGDVTTNKLAIGKLLTDKNLGDISTDITTKLVWNSRNGIDAKVTGEINEIDYNGYTYKDISLDGDINEDFFKGKAVINDINAALTFDGLISFSDTIPSFNFKSSIKNLNFNELNLTNDSIDRILCADVIVNGEGSNLDNINGFAVINDLSYLQNGKEYEAEEIELVASPKQDGRILNITSSIVDATIDGNFSFKELPKCIDYITYKVVPAIYEDTTNIQVNNQKFSFDALVKDYKPIQELFTPELYFSKNTLTIGAFDSDQSTFNLLLKSDTIKVLDRSFAKVDAYVKKPDEKIAIDVNVKEANVNPSIVLENLNFKTTIKDNLIEPSLSWESKNGDSYGFIQGNGYWYSLEYFDFLILPSYFNYDNTVWKNDDFAEVIIDGKTIVIDSLIFNNNNGEQITVTDTISENPNETLKLTIENFQLANINSIFDLTDVKYYGEINGNASLGNLYDSPSIVSDIEIKELKTNDFIVGDLNFNTNWDNKEDPIACIGYLNRLGNKAFDFKGTYNPKLDKNSLDIACEMNNTPIAFVGFYLKDQGIDDLNGFVSGNIDITGEPEKPILQGKAELKNVGFKVDYLNTFYDFTGELNIGEDEFYTDNVILIRDQENNLATFNGAIYHNNFRDFDYNIFIDIPQNIYTKGNIKKNIPFNNAKKVPNQFLTLNTNESLNSSFYGKVYNTGDINIEGEAGGEITITVNAKTKKGTVFTLPLYNSNEVALEDYIVFVDTSKKIEIDSNEFSLEGLNLDLNIEATPDAELKIILDEVYGDVMKGRGSGNINMSVDENNELNMTGRYEIEEGDYLFTLGVLNFENLINKKFQIASGSTLNWYGDPLKAEIDITAIYNLKASLYDIITDPSKKELYKNRTDVECYMNLTQNLLKPDVDFAIEIPRTDEEGRTALNNLIQTEEELNKQVFSLLILNRFLPPANSVTDEGRSGNAVGSTLSELASNQLSNWLSQITNKADIGLNYRPGDNITNDELALALSTQLLNNRVVVSVNGGLSFDGDETTDDNNLLLDANVEYKLNKDGTFRVRAFTRTNEDDVTNTQNQGATTQGVGLSFKKDFNRLRKKKVDK